TSLKLRPAYQLSKSGVPKVPMASPLSGIGEVWWTDRCARPRKGDSTVMPASVKVWSAFSRQSAISGHVWPVVGPARYTIGLLIFFLQGQEFHLSVKAAGPDVPAVG